MLLDRQLNPPRRMRVTPAERLRRAVLTLAGDKAQVLAHSETGWASITFTGTRHAMSLEFRGVDAVETGEAFIAALPDHEFALPRTLVADAAITSADHTLLPEPRLAVGIELLLLDEG